MNLNVRKLNTVMTLVIGRIHTKYNCKHYLI